MTTRASIRLLLDETRSQSEELQDQMEQAQALIDELKSMMTAAMEIMDSMKYDDIKAIVDFNLGRLDELAEATETIAPINEKLDRLHAATEAMSAKVDADATPVNPYTSTFNEQV